MNGSGSDKASYVDLVSPGALGHLEGRQESTDGDRGRRFLARRSGCRDGPVVSTVDRGARRSASGRRRGPRGRARHTPRGTVTEARGC